MSTPDTVLGEVQESPSNAYKTRDMTDDDKVVVKQPSGIKVPVTFLPVAEMPSKKIFGDIDPLEGSPAREMTKKLMSGDIPLGQFAEKLQ